MTFRICWGRVASGRSSRPFPRRRGPGDGGVLFGHCKKKWRKQRVYGDGYFNGYYYYYYY